jgi:hypothetical protein
MSVEGLAFFSWNNLFIKLNFSTPMVRDCTSNPQLYIRTCGFLSGEDDGDCQG